MFPLLLALGAAVGFSLGLTGGGGAVFAVPLLVYVVGLPPRDAVAVSLATVAAAAVVGVAQRVRAGLVEFPTGLLFAGAGVLGAPLGAALSKLAPEWLLLSLFGGLMLVIAARAWLHAGAARAESPWLADDDARPTCRRDPAGELQLTSRCAALLAAIGLATGVLTGLFGVGGGFIIVPALTTFSGMGQRRAVGTSLLVIALVSLAGLSGQLFAGRLLTGELFTGPSLAVPSALWSVGAVFTAGAVAGMLAGGWLARKIAGAALQRVFAAAIVLVALFVLAKNVARW